MEVVIIRDGQRSTVSVILPRFEFSPFFFFFCLNLNPQTLQQFKVFNFFSDFCCGHVASSLDPIPRGRSDEVHVYHLNALVKSDLKCKLYSHKDMDLYHCDGDDEGVIVFPFLFKSPDYLVSYFTQLL